MADKPVVRYGGDSAFRPFEYLGDDGRAQGFQIDLLAELARAGGFEVVVELGEWAAVEQRFRAGALDLVAMVDVASRREWAQFLRSHATPVIGLYRRQAHADPQALQSLAGQVVALDDSLPMRDTRAAYLEGTGASFVDTPSPLASLQAVRHRRADVALMPRAYGDPLLASGVVAGVVAGSLSLRLQSYAFAVAPGNVVLQQRLSAALAQLEASGRLEALRVRWLGSHNDGAVQVRLKEKLLQQQVLGLGVVAGGALALGGLAVLLRRRTRLARVEGAGRRAAEAALAQAEAKLAQSFARNPDAMLVTAFDSGVVLDVNDAMCRLTGVEPEALLGQRIEDLPALADPANLPSLRAMLQRDGAFDAAPMRVVRADGALRACLVSCELMNVGGVAHVFAVLRDVTQRLAEDDTTRAAYDTLIAQMAAQHSAALAAERLAGQQRTAAVQQSVERTTTAVVHNLKEPLRTMRGLVGLLHQHLDAGNLTQARANADQIDQASQRMDTMIAALARLAQVERGSLRRQTVDMAAMAQSVCATTAAARPAPQVNYSVAALPAAQADPELVAQVWQQLADNAWKFMRRSEGAKVRIDSVEQAGRTWYRVVDNGVGFDIAAAVRLFVPFQRMHRARDFSGIGIGLALAQRIVLRHGGELRVHSGVGAGTVVEFTLEAAPVSVSVSVPESPSPPST